MAKVLFTLILIYTMQICLSDHNEYQFKYKLINSLSEINRNSDRAEVVSLCKLHVAQYLMDLNSTQMWALSMLDATAKINSGILVGNLVNMGNFDQCLNVEHDTGVTGVIRGQHCMVPVALNLTDLPNITGQQYATRWSNFKNRKDNVIANFGFRIGDRDPQKLILGFGVCIPASCQGDELVELLEMYLSLANLNLDSTFNPERKCSTIEPVDLSTGDMVAIIIYSMIAVLMVLSTLYDLYLVFNSAQGNKSGKKMFLAFSVYSNAKRIFALHPNPPDNTRSDNITCIHGIRAISIIWIMLGHRYLTSAVFSFDNSLEILNWFAKYHSALIVGSTVSVDTFFVLSGILLGYTFMKQKSTGKNVNILMMYVHRYLRLTPALAAAVLFQATLMIHMSSGPNWKESYNAQKVCAEHWWPSLLYIQNYVNKREMCLGQTWYLQIDMQLYILSPILLFALWHFPKTAIGAAVILILGNIGIVFGIVYLHDKELGKMMPLSDPDFDIYNTTYTRYGPVVMGVLLGYTLCKTRKVDVKLNKILVVIAWLSACAVMLAVVLGYYPFYQLDYNLNVIEDSFYLSFSRISWSVAICWVIFACTVGYGGIVNWFLSHPLWQPLSRLSYCMYLTHMTVQMMITNSGKSPGHFSDMDMIYHFWGDFGITLSVSILWSLAFESPMSIIENELFQGPKKGIERRRSVVEKTSQLENGDGFHDKD